MVTATKGRTSEHVWPHLRIRTPLRVSTRRDVRVDELSAVVTRRAVQITVGLFWLLVGALQFQSYMFTRGFATQIIAPLGQGQPWIVSQPVHWTVDLVAAHPLAWNIPFATIQTLLGLAILVPRTARIGLAASVAWAVGVWWLGEGMGGVLDGHASLLTGAPGAVLLYGVLALAAWPRRGRTDIRPAFWLLPAWTVLWVGGAIFQALPGQNTAGDVSGIVSGSAGSAPGWLNRLDGHLAPWIGRQGSWFVVALVALEVLIGIGILFRSTRRYAAVAGFVFAVAFWLFCQSAGALTTGQATDPNSGLIIAVMAVAVFAIQGTLGERYDLHLSGRSERNPASHSVPASAQGLS
jgi:hypothetical protein